MQPLFSLDNRLFTLARSGKRLPHILLAIPMSLVILFGAGILGAIPALLLLALFNGQLTQSSALWSALQGILILVTSFAPIFLLLWAWLALVEKRPLWTIGLLREGLFSKYLRGVAFGLLMFAVTVGILLISGAVTIDATPSPLKGLPALGGVLLIYLGWTVQGPAEEALTRGWLLPVVGARYKPWLGILVSSLLFAFYHSLNPGLSLLAVLNLFLFAVMMAFYALYEGSLWGVFGVHAIWNWAEGNLFGFQVSGTPAWGGTLLEMKPTGAAILNGGGFGPEGGLAVTAVLLLGILALLLLARKKRSPVSGQGNAT